MTFFEVWFLLMVGGLAILSMLIVAAWMIFSFSSTQNFSGEK